MTSPLSHDMPCSGCHHPGHHFIPCDRPGCTCTPPPTPGIYLDKATGGTP